MNHAILSSLRDGAVAVTPNRRLARALLQSFDAEQRASGLSAWPTPAILPYATWLISLWGTMVSAGAIDPILLLSAAQSTLLWEDIVGADGRALLNPRGAATLASEAWTLAHAWGGGGESWRGWRRDDREGDDPSIFAAWAESYASALRRGDMRDLAQVPDLLAALAPRIAAARRATVLAGFVAFTPQQERLFSALSAAGATLARLDTVQAAEALPRRVTAPSRRIEMSVALGWARDRALARPSARLGIVVEDLAQRREEVVALAEDILCPRTILPGESPRPQPFEISLGRSLESMPIVAAALDMIELAQSRLDCGAAAALLRSPYLPGADTGWSARAGIERDWLEQGRRDVTLADAIAALDRRSPALASQWRSASAMLEGAQAAAPRTWADAWRAWLAGAGWPGSRVLDSAEYQARDSWEALLLEFSSLNAVTRRMDRGSATAKLRSMAAERVFQPEGSAAPIQILGVLEASGLPFDALWVSGLVAEAWPPAPSPNPMLPIAWQRERAMPRANADVDLAYFRTLTAGFAGAAAEVVFSSAASIDDHPVSPSSLIADYAEMPLPALTRSWTMAIAAERHIESVTDDRAPSLARGSLVPGGSRIVAAQSDCPFQAAARHRLDARAWPEPLGSLSARERGELVHLAMAAFWNLVPDQASLTALDPIGFSAIADASVETALGQFSAVRWRSLAPLVRAAEGTRLARLLSAWADVERARPPFTVASVESGALVQLASLTFRIRLDRVDALADGGSAIIDFKTGRVVSPAQWFEPRPRAVQLGMYVTAERDARPDVAVRAAAYVHLRPEGAVAAGVAADPRAWPALTEASKTVPGDWPSLEAWWRSSLAALASEIAAGHAAVSPRQSPLPCRICDLQPFCRIQSVRNLAEQSSDDD